MSTQRQPEQPESPEEVTDQQVAQYLRTHAEFFETHGDLLLRLRLPHKPGGSAVSLIERQVDLMRQRNRKLDRKLRELLAVARSNERLVLKIHSLSLRLLGANGMTEMLELLESTLRQDFGADRAVLVLLDDAGKSADLQDLNFLRRVGRDGPEMQPFATFVQGSRPRCGQVRDSQREVLFGTDSDAIGSAALIPLGEKCRYGILAIGNQDSAHFHPAMSTDFLLRIGEQVAAALARELS